MGGGIRYSFSFCLDTAKKEGSTEREAAWGPPRSRGAPESLPFLAADRGATRGFHGGEERESDAAGIGCCRTCGSASEACLNHCPHGGQVYFIMGIPRWGRENQMLPESDAAAPAGPPARR